MKLITMTLLVLLLGLSAFGQNEPSKSSPPIKILPEENKVKRIYELPAKTDYEIFNSKGQLIDTGNARFFDYTDYKAGLFFIRFDGKTHKIIKE